MFSGIAALGKTTKGWFFGLKLHMVINEAGQIMNMMFIRGNVDDRAVVPEITKKLTGLLFGDRGYISKKLFTELYDRGLKLITGLRKDMQNKLMDVKEKLLLRKRLLIDS